MMLALAGCGLCRAEDLPRLTVATSAFLFKIHPTEILWE
jgi:hypothetical protein